MLPTLDGGRDAAARGGARRARGAGAARGRAAGDVDEVLLDSLPISIYGGG